MKRTEESKTTSRFWVDSNVITVLAKPGGAEVGGGEMWAKDAL